MPICAGAAAGGASAKQGLDGRQELDGKLRAGQGRQGLGKADMKPNFALDLSHDGISLLHRNEGSRQGWTLVGEVALDDPDMTARLEMLRKTATELEPGGLATKLVIPPSQILFAEVAAPGGDDITREVRIREALDGMTPYEVGELVFDWRRAKGQNVRIAVVARETLQEAESFARDHRFNPVSFVARGEKGFRGEAFFGMAAGASALLGPGVHVEPDEKPLPKIAALRPQSPDRPGADDADRKRKAEDAAGGAAGKTEGAKEGAKEETGKQTGEPARPEMPGKAPAEEARADAPARRAGREAAPPVTEPVTEPDTVAGPEAKEGASPPHTPLDASDDASGGASAATPEDDAEGKAEDEDARIAALLAEVPEPEPAGGDDAPDSDKDPAPAEGTSEAKQARAGRTSRRGKSGSGAVAPPVLAPFPPSLDDDAPRPSAPLRPGAGAKPAVPGGAKGGASSAKGAGKDAGKAGAGRRSAPPPPPPPRRELPPLPGMIPASGTGREAKVGADTGTIGAPEPPLAGAPGNGPVPAFSSRRRAAPDGAARQAAPGAPGGVSPESAPPPRNGPNGAIPPPSSLHADATGATDRRTGTGGAPAGSSGVALRLSRAASRAVTAARGLVGRPGTAPAPRSPGTPKDPASPAASGGARRLRLPGIGTRLKAALGRRGRGAGPAGTAPPGPADTAQAKGQARQAVTEGAGETTQIPASAAPTAIAPAPPPAPGKGARAQAGISEAERLTMFGARPGQREQVGGKPKYLGLVLTLILLLAMAVIALGSVFLLGEADETGTAPGAGSDFAAASVPSALLPGPSDETGASLPAASGVSPAPGSSVSGPALQPGAPQSPAGPEISTAPIAPLSPGTPPVEATEAPAEAGAEPALPERPGPSRGPETLDDGTAQTRYAATGIWERAPERPPEPRSSRIDDLYIASIDPKVSDHDAVALPPVESIATDTRPPTPLPPAAPGSEFALDDEGLVTPSPEGTLSPAGILVYSGRPEVVPPPRPGTARPRALPADELRRLRPKPRPIGLVEESERLNNGGITRQELAALRPNPRPEPPPAAETAAIDSGAVDAAVAGALAAGELINVTDEAVAASPLPGHRPGNFAAIVASARPGADASDGSTVVAASAASTVSPPIPTRANVAAQATQRNALHLNQVNLIGIYGSASSRRALVRLKNGRYTKVSVGDRLNGGKVVSITENRLIYTRNGRNVTLELPSLG